MPDVFTNPKLGFLKEIYKAWIFAIQLLTVISVMRPIFDLYAAPASAPQSGVPQYPKHHNPLCISVLGTFQPTYTASILETCRVAR
jgi:hypothetical protein